MSDYIEDRNIHDPIPDAAFEATGTIRTSSTTCLPQAKEAPKNLSGLVLSLERQYDPGPARKETGGMNKRPWGGKEEITKKRKQKKKNTRARLSGLAGGCALGEEPPSCLVSFFPFPQPPSHFFNLLFSQPLITSSATVILTHLILHSSNHLVHIAIQSISSISALLESPSPPPELSSKNTPQPFAYLPRPPVVESFGVILRGKAHGWDVYLDAGRLTFSSPTPPCSFFFWRKRDY